jgi:hypothetical protein
VRLLAFLLLLLAAGPARAAPASVVARATPGALALVVEGRPPAILADPRDGPGVMHAARDLAADFGRVTGTAAPLGRAPGPLVIVGTIGSNPLIDRLAREGKLDLSGVRGTWEAYVHQIVANPLPGVARALVIAGADRRGTIFGIYDLSQGIGVSPWFWWADVPVARRAALWVTPGRRADHPRVRYRGIFINDEDPALLGWATHTFGGFNHRFYEHVFELILRSRANLLWPAMWGKSFFEDDPENARLAEEMGVVIGTSHHEPLMRAHVDWARHGEGPWDYTRNAARLRRFWREGMARTQGQDRIVTVGMRGDGDEPMTQGTAIPLLERIVADQRAIIADVTRRPAAETPQVWALYKEVQDYYDAGMRVPDDVTLLFSDDNWGNLRRLPAPGARRAGGYGVYYHFDYVGGPRNYKWINTTQIARVWEQLHLAYAHGVDRLWIVNVGDIKPMEFPTSFFLDYAWNPDAWPLERLADYPREWAARQFGPDHAAQIGDLLTRYALYAARRKPELIDADTYSLDAWNEWPRVVAEWDVLEQEATLLQGRLPAEYRDAYFELVLHPILANANLHRLYYAVARNRRAAHAGDGESARRFADEAGRLFARDREIRRIYEEDIAGGRWTDMMAQTHIGYTSWQQPDADRLPDLLRGADPLPRPALPPPPVPPHVAIRADRFSARVGDWRVIPDLGLYGAAVSFFPVTAPARHPGGTSPRLDYAFDLAGAGDAIVEVTLSPTLDFAGRGGLRYAVSIDDGTPVIVNVNGGMSDADWERAVADNRWVRATRFADIAPGRHVLRLWAVDPGLDVQRLVVTRGRLPDSYLGPPETAAR